MEKTGELEGNQLERQSWRFQPWKEPSLSSEGLEHFCSAASVLVTLARGSEVNEGCFQRGGADTRVETERK